ncbi:MarR family winged helix-turn-helix transcriptional regulator [Staphylococcus pseudoxylosus]|uniref:MarR family winged helix-turn-helix transcriptional regulator n=1 Tax=Staphylococcus pseudoxylosus TaxID=2282419 RepID=UPI002DBB1475|nr:winged helix-turn-helix transcriptional regulator [Staphylococcus pseudoxylosus]MEB7754504.1 winged helix-turn-helix transcriptional regulator [Staphylococcus pseudoxylosus]
MKSSNEDWEIIIKQFYLVIMHINKDISEIVSKVDNLLSCEQIEAMILIQSKRKITVNELADKQSVYKTAASKRVKKLETKGYVQCIYSDNKRIKLVGLTSEGEILLETITLLLTKSIERYLINYFTPKQFKEVVNQLTNIESAFIQKNNTLTSLI